jgi:hypothetical protein
VSGVEGAWQGVIVPGRPGEVDFLFGRTRREFTLPFLAYSSEEQKEGLFRSRARNFSHTTTANYPEKFKPRQLFNTTYS